MQGEDRWVAGGLAVVQGVFALLLHGVREGKGRVAKQKRSAGRGPRAGGQAQAVSLRGA